MVVVIVYFLKKRNLIVLSVKKPESPTVSFENPFYTVRDQANVTQVNNKSTVVILTKFPNLHPDILFLQSSSLDFIITW